MASLTKRTLGCFATAAIFATPTAAFAEENTATESKATESTAAANQNVSTTNRTQENFRAYNFVGRTETFILELAKNNRDGKNIFIAWGGNSALQLEALRGIQDFSRNNPNVEIVFIAGPERNGYAGDIELQFMPQGQVRSVIGEHGQDNTDTLRRTTYMVAQREFSQSRSLAALNPQ